MISTGPSRADGLEGVEKMDRTAGEVMRAYLDEVVKWVICSTSTAISCWDSPHLREVMEGG